MSRNHLQGEHLFVPTARFLSTSDAGGGVPDAGPVLRVVRCPEPGGALVIPRRQPDTTQLLWVVAGGAVAPTARDQTIPIPHGSFLALGGQTCTERWRAGDSGATLLVLSIPEREETFHGDLSGVVDVQPDIDALTKIPLPWQGQGACRRAVLGTNGNFMTLSLLTFGSAVDQLPARAFPHGEIWVMLWGGAEICGRRYTRGQVGAVGPQAIYGPSQIEAGTLVLVFTPRCPRAPEPRPVAVDERVSA